MKQGFMYTDHTYNKNPTGTHVSKHVNATKRTLQVMTCTLNGTDLHRRPHPQTTQRIVLDSQTQSKPHTITASTHSRRLPCAGLHDNSTAHFLPRWQKVRQSRATQPGCTTDVSDWTATPAVQPTFWDSDSFIFLSGMVTSGTV